MIAITGRTRYWRYNRGVLTRPRAHTYSSRRLRIVVLLLTAVTLPVVLGMSFLIYQYLHYGVMVERRLQGERWLVPSKVYARPLTLRASLVLNERQLIRTLNTLKYEQKKELPPAPGEFAVGEGHVTFAPRGGPDTADEPVQVVFKDGSVQALIGLTSKRRYASQTLEPELITHLFDESREKRRLVRYEELPEHVIKAVLAIEDRRFFSHPGLDPFRIVGAAVRNIQAESFIQGGSTITQQLVKNFFLTPERTFKRKLQEALLALVLERRAGKKHILELYLNEIYLGQSGSFSINGIGEAARAYFQKDVGNLTLPEGALLAGMIQSPNPYNPRRHPERAKRRRNHVLGAMRGAGFLTPEEAEAAIALPLYVQKSTVDRVEAPYFVDLVKAQLARRYDAQLLNTQNLTIHTSLDLHLQDLAQAAMRKGLEALDELVKPENGQVIQGSLIALEPATGRVVALVGGRSYGASQYNRAIRARRQPGSTFKPFVYLTAIEATFENPALPPITPATIVEDAPAVFFYEDKEYIPANYQDKYFGHVTLRRALAKSLNVATVKVAEMVGFDRVAELWTEKMQMSAEVRGYPALALGAFEASPLEMAQAYNLLANGGLKVDPVTVLAVLDDRGRTLEQHEPTPPLRVVHAESAFIVTHMMRSVLNEGTAYSARAQGFSADAAGKTGTTNDMRDAWFAGFTPNLLAVVWVGMDDNTPINLPGSRAALPIWIEFMKAALAGVESTPFSVPEENVVFLDIDAETGLLATPYCPKVTSEAFITGTEPHEPCLYH